MKCVNCDKETANPKFCCRSCAAIYTNKISPKRKLTKNCCKQGCDNLVRNYRSTLCQQHFEERQLTQKENMLNTTLAEIRSLYPDLHSSSKHAKIRGFARNWFKDLTKLPCANCGYDKHVELCHIKAISDFKDTETVGDVNSLENIIQLCPNCHWEFDNGILKNEWRLRQDSNLH